MQRRSPVVLVMLASVAGAGAAHASDAPIYAPAPAWVLAAPPIDATKLTDASPVVVVADEQQRIEANRVTDYTDRAVRIATTQLQTQLGTLSLAWQPDKGDLTVHRVDLIRGAERIDLLAGKKPFEVLRREQRMEQFELDGMLTATMQVEGIRIGDVLRVTYSISHADDALKGHAQAYAALPAAPFKAGFARSRLLWPASQTVRVASTVEGLTLAPVARGSERELVIALPLAKQAELPDDVPVRFQRPPMLEATTFAEWGEVSRTMAPLFATSKAIAPGSPLDGEVKAIRVAERDPTRRAARALRIVQDQVRYQAMGMNGGNYVPQPVETTWRTRYGDCKAKTLLLLAMLRALDIEAEPVLASSGMGGLVSQRLPAPGAFDHVLVRATIDGKTLWLDGTGGGTRLADLSDTPPFMTVLPVRIEGAGLIPLAMHADARPQISLETRYDDSAGLGLPTLVDVRVTLRGAQAEASKLLQSQMDEEQRRALISGTVTPIVGEIQVADGEISYDAEAGTATIHATGVVTTGWKRQDQRYERGIDRILEDMAFAPDRAKAAWRALPVQAAMPGGMAVRETFVLPSKGVGYAIEAAPLDSTLAGMRVTRTAVLEDGVVTTEQRSDGTGAEIASADLPAARAAIASAKARPFRILAPRAVPTRAELAMEARRNGGLARIEAAFAKAIANDPEEMTGYASRAALRRGLFDYKGAIADYDRVIALAPDVDVYMKRSAAWRALGDSAKATKDAEAALELDPSSVNALSTIAALKAERGDTKGALTLLDSRIAEGGENADAFRQMKAEILVLAKATPEAVAVLDEALAAKPTDASLLNSRCWTRATGNLALDAALRDCTKAIELAGNPSSILDSRALVYYRLGRFEEALGDLNAALDSAPDQSASRFLRGVTLRRAGKITEGNADLAQARLTWPQVDKSYARWGIVP